MGRALRDDDMKSFEVFTEFKQLGIDKVSSLHHNHNHPRSSAARVGGGLRKRPAGRAQSAA